MLANFHLPNSTFADIQIFNANSAAAAQCWAPWVKRKGASMIHMLCVGSGGAGGAGAIGANGLAGGGGGGGGANVSMLLIPAFLVPDVLYVSVAYGSNSANGASSYIAIQKSTATGAGSVAQHCFLVANGGAVGGAASGGTAGSAGGQPTTQAVADCGLCNLGQVFFYRGLAGSAGGTSASTATVGGALTYATGLGLTVGGTGGGGVHQTAANNGLAGGLVTALSNSVYPGQPAATGGTSAALAQSGRNGYQTVPGLFNFTPATGGGAGYSAAGSFIQGGGGGDGMFGCGGGGSGGSFTGASAPVRGKGGDGIVIITAW